MQIYAACWGPGGGRLGWGFPERREAVLKYPLASRLGQVKPPEVMLIFGPSWKRTLQVHGAFSGPRSVQGCLQQSSHLSLGCAARVRTQASSELPPSPLGSTIERGHVLRAMTAAGYGPPTYQGHCLIPLSSKHTREAFVRPISQMERLSLTDGASCPTSCHRSVWSWN